MAPVTNDGSPQGALEAGTDASGAPVVRLIGEIDISNADEISVELDAVAVEGSQLVIDLAGLEFMDSSGIAMLLRAAAHVDALELRNPSSTVRRIIECTGLTDILRMTS